MNPFKFLRKITGQETYHDLIQDYCKKIVSNPGLNERMPSIGGFAAYVLETKKDYSLVNISAIILNVFGLLGALRFVEDYSIPSHILVGRLATPLEVYQNEVSRMVHNTLITLQHDLGIICRGSLSPVSLPIGTEYRWPPRQSGNPTGPIDHIRYDFARFFNLYPFPDRLVKVLNLGEPPSLKRLLAKQEWLTEIVRRALELENPVGKGLALSNEDEELLLKNGAFITGRMTTSQREDGSTVHWETTTVRSWVDMIAEWVDQSIPVGDKHSASRWFKLAHMVRKFERTIRKTPSAPVLTSSSSSGQGSNAASCSYATLPLTAPLSFQDYLIKRSINRLFSPYLDEETRMRKYLAAIFKSSDEKRIDFLFFWQILHSLFLEEHQEKLKPKLKEIIDRVLPLKKDFSPILRADEIRARIFAGADVQIHLFSELVLHLFLLEKFAFRKLPSCKKPILVSWIYQRLNGSRENDSRFWLALLENKIPKVCFNILFNQFQKRYEYVQKNFFLTWELFCLFSRDSNLDVIVSCFTNLKFEFYFKIVAQAEPTKSKVDIAGDLLRYYGFSEGHLNHALFDSLIFLFCCQEYMQLSVNAQSFLFDRLLDLSSTSRAHLQTQLTKFSQKQNPYAIREELLKALWKRKLGEEDGELFALKEMVDFQIEVIHQIEEIISSPVPVATVLILFLYCPYVPVLGIEEGVSPHHFVRPKLIQQLDALRQLKASFFKEKKLFLNPVTLAEIDNLTNSIFDSEMVLSSQEYTNDAHHPVCLEMHLGGIRTFLDSIMVPTFKLGTTLLELTRALALPEATSNLAALQNSICFISGEQVGDGFYFGEWQSIVHMARWIDNADGFLVLEMVLWRSLYNLESRIIHIPFEISRKEFSAILLEMPKQKQSESSTSLKEVLEHRQSSSWTSVVLEETPDNSVDRFFSLFSMMWETVGEELASEESPGLLQSLEGEEQELSYCLERFKHLKAPWEEFLKGGEHCKRVAEALFRFVRDFKINARNAQAHLYQEARDQQAERERPYAAFRNPPHLQEVYDDASSGLLNTFGENFSLSASALSNLPLPTILHADSLSSSDDEAVLLSHSSHSHIQSNLEVVCAECRSLSTSKTYKICEVKGNRGQWSLDLRFDPSTEIGDTVSSLRSGSSSSSSSSSSSPSQIEMGEDENNKFTAILHLDETDLDYSFNMGELLHHPRAPFLLKWLIDTLNERHQDVL